MGVKYYVIQNLYLYLSDKELQVYELKANSKYVLVKRKENFMTELNLGIQLWKGLFEGEDSVWSRWCSKDGDVLMTGKERAEMEKAEKEKERADMEKQPADKAEEELRQLKAQLDALKNQSLK